MSPCIGSSHKNDDNIELEGYYQMHANSHHDRGTRRKCRDVLCLALFISAWVGMLAISFFVIKYGDPMQFLRGKDHLGNVCGQDNTKNNDLPVANALDMRDKPFVYFYNVSPSLQVLDSNLDGLCVSTCPNKFSSAIEDWVCQYDVTRPSLDSLFKQCWISYPTVDIAGFCLPLTFSGDIFNHVTSLNVHSYISGIIEDIYICRYVILISILVAFALGLVWLIFMRFFTTTVIWFGIWLTLILLVLSTFHLWKVGLKKWEIFNTLEPNVQSQSAYIYQVPLYGAYALCGFTSLYSLVVLLLCGRIQLAAEICEEATRAFASMFLELILWPLVPLCSIVVVSTFSIVIFLFTLSVGQPSYSEIVQATQVEYTTVRNIALAYQLLFYLWTTNWILGVNDVTICGAIADWFWTFEGKHMKPLPVLRSFFRTITYNSGSVVFGALILGIVQFLRLFILWLRNQFGGGQNRVNRWLLRIADFLGYLFQKFIEFLNKNTYVMIGVYGQSFCVSAQRAFQIISSNPIRILTLNCINIFNMIVGKILITIITVGLACVYIERYLTVQLILVPIVVIAVLSFLVACIIMAIYDMAVHTILFCFIEDESRNDGSLQSPYHMSDNLRTFVQTYGNVGCSCL